MPKRPQNGIGDKRKRDIQNLNRNAKSKMKRIEKKYGVKVDLEIKKPSDFKTVKEFNAYKGIRAFHKPIF
jgi:ribosomal protein S13